MVCKHCQRREPERGYCCEKAELDALRSVVDEVTRHLSSEIVVPSALGVQVESVALARDKLAQVRAA